jgi:alkanesulfonate monooxygenase SsuD/methylene tetrahydromethanopterin reductase-like flavin-dependent oxidoreductase (luciferase family)
MLITQFATTNRLAPGRVRIGLGSGSFTRSLLGMRPLRVRQLREELAVLRALLDEHTADVDGTRIGFSEWERGCLNLDDPLPLEVAAQGPRTAALAGELGNGLTISGEVRPERLRSLLDAALEAARAASRPTDHFSFTADLGPLCVVRSGEALDTPRVIGVVQPAISTHFIFFLMMRVDPDEVDTLTRDSYVAFLSWARDEYGPDPDEQFRGLLRKGYVGRDPAHDRFVTPEVIEAHTLTGPLEALAERVQDIGRAGVTDVNVLRRLDRPWADDDSLADVVALMERVG